jgi:hypothetical protein
MSGSSEPKRSLDTPIGEPVSGPRPEDFSGDAVAKAVLKESLEHPATIYPAAGSALALGWTFIIAASPASIALSLGFAFIGASAFVFNYVVKGPERAAARVNELRALRRKSKLATLDRLVIECQHACLPEGASEAVELKTAYTQLIEYLESQKESASAERFHLLAEDTLTQGLLVLEQALTVFNAVATVDVLTVQRELDGFMKQRSSTTNNETIKAIDLEIAGHQKRIALFNRRQEDIAQLFAQVNDIESALQTTYLELVDLNNQDIAVSLSDDGGAAQRLKSAVESARKVEQRLRGDHSENQETKDKYLKAYALNRNEQINGQISEDG